MYILSQYATARSIYFPLIDFGGTSFEATPVVFVAGDSKISIDGAAFANTTNAPVHVALGIYKISLTAGEMTGKVIVVTVIDTATKEWEDQSIILQTINNASAQIENVANASLNADAVWDELVVGHQTVSTFGNAFDDAAIPPIASVASVTSVAVAGRNEIADSMYKRDVDAVEATAPVHSLASMVLKLVSRFKAGTGQTFRTDGITVHMTQTPTSSAVADPIIELAAGV